MFSMIRPAEESPVASQTRLLPQETEASRGREQLGLWRLAAWGSAATLGLVVVAVVSQTPTGKNRLHMALAGTPSPDSAVILAAAERRADLAQAETKRLTSKLRELSADRDRLSRRVASFERSMNDITGSISRQIAAAKAAEATPPPALPSPLFAPLVLPAGQATGKRRAKALPQSEPAKPAAVFHKSASTTPAAASSDAKAVPLRSTPAAGPEVVMGPLPAPLGAAASDPSHAPPVPRVSPSPAPKVVTTVNVPMPPVRIAALSTGEPRPALKAQYAVELGGARSRDFLRAQWAAVKANFGPLFAGLHARVAHDRRPGHQAYQLLIGPLASNGAAVRLCAHLGVRPCHAARFAGSPLAER